LCWLFAGFAQLEDGSMFKLKINNLTRILTEEDKKQIEFAKKVGAASIICAFVSDTRLFSSV
jgi:hypothetical protein